MVSSRACYRAVCRCPSDVLAPAADRDRFRRILTQRCSLVGHGSASAHLPQSQLKAISAVQADADADIPLPDEGPEREGDESEDSHNADGQPGSDDEGEDLQDGAERDYRENELLDQYEESGLADEEAAGEEDVTLEEVMERRRLAEREMGKRDRREGRHVLPGALDESSDEEMEERRPFRRRRVEAAQAGQVDDEEGELELPFGEVRGHTREWVAQEPIQRQIGRRFRNFLDRFKDDNGDLVYRDRIKDMCIRNEQSLVISFEHFSMAQPEIAMWFVDVPRLVIGVFNRNAKDAVLSIMPSYENVQPEIFVRFEGMPIVDKIRDIRQFHLNRLVRFQGVVTRRTGVFPQLQMVKYDCVKCGYILGPFFQNNEKEVKPGSCPQCQSQGPWNESPGTVPAGRLPRHKEVILLHDLIDKARPGEEVDVTAIYTNTYDAGLNVRNGFPVFSTSMEAQWVARNEDLYSAFKLTDEDRAEIHQLARDPNIGKRIVKSIAPSIYGHLNIKAGVALAMFGGQAKQPSGKHRLRGDINMLVLGDPGTAKSQFLKYVEKVAQRAVYTTGKGASAVGLTASVQKDPITREWTLEGGALVLADKGVCLIDEFDKMNDQDRVSIHEAMEQQSISISKAGIVTQLQARCSVMAAANPVGGRYDSSRTFAENVELTDPILSRFDILCVVKDIVDPVLDERLAEFVISSHMHSHPNQAELNDANGPELEPDMLSQDMLRKYITYAKANCRPKLQNADYEKITQVYADLRRESAISHGMPIAVRHLESIIRMSEAHAAMHLREYVNSDDVDMAIRVMLESFISTQKTSVQKAMTKRFRHYLSHAQDLNDLILHALQGLVREQLRAEQVTGEAGGSNITIPCRALEERVREYDVLDIKQFFASPHFLNAGFELDQGAAVITRPR